MAEAVTERAPAKLNPYLRVLRRRDDGFHDVETIVLPLDLADTVSVRVSAERRVTLRATGPRGYEVPAGEHNLVVRAANSFAAAIREGRGADITLEKHVPVAAGLGGGSSDAAATLRALDRVWGAGVGMDRLLEIAARVGSDVPAMVVGRPVVATGRGDVVAPVEARPTWWVLVTFDAGIRARDAYGWWDRGLVRRLRRQPPIGPALRALSAGDLQGLGGAMFNALEPGILRRHPSVAAARRALLEGGPPHEQARGGGALGVIVSGSGPTVVGLCRDREHADRLARALGGIATRSPA